MNELGNGNLTKGGVIPVCGCGVMCRLTEKNGEIVDLVHLTLDADNVW